MSIIDNKKIAIVGGGPGGLTLARLLQRRGAEVKVYERDASKDARKQGATLDLHEESGLKALREAGLMDAFKANFRPGAEKMRVMDKSGRIVFEDRSGAGEEVSRREVGEEGYRLGAGEEVSRLEAGEGISRPEIDRGPLQQLLLDSLAPGTVLWGRHFDSLTPKNGSWELVFKNGETAMADLVIGADGARSGIRPYITPIKPFYSGIMVVEGAVYHSETAIPAMHTLLNGGKIFAFGDEKSLIVSSKGDGSLVFYTSWKANESWVRESGIDFSDKGWVLDWFRAAYAGWDRVYEELFEHAEVPFVTRPIYSMPLDQDWEALPNLTMLGDAAHLMPPFAGEGVNMAMLDALELSECLVSGDFPGMQPAIAAYEKEMRRRAAGAAGQSLESGEIMHSPEAIPFLISVVS